MSDPPPGEDLEDLYENAPCGQVSLLSDARIARLNLTLADWIGEPADSLVGRPFQELLSFGSRIAYETHIAPLLRLQGFVDEIAIDMLRSDGSRIPVIANAVEKRDAEGRHLFTRIILLKAVERRSYERNLVDARAEAEAVARTEHETAVLREQFIAVLGHDLRNPLAALAAGIRMIERRETLSETGRRVTTEMGASVARAAALIDNLLDFARGRLGEGLALSRDEAEPLTPVLEHIAGEIRAIAPDRQILTDFSIDEPVNCDRARIGQLLSNLISNAVTHGAPGMPVEVTAATRAGMFVLSVANGGLAIPPAARAQLFQPFFRGAVRRSQQGLGLGLFIVSEIAKAHGGTMDVASSDDETRFTFSLPLQADR